MQCEHWIPCSSFEYIKVENILFHFKLEFKFKTVLHNFQKKTSFELQGIHRPASLMLHKPATLDISTLGLSFIFYNVFEKS